MTIIGLGLAAIAAVKAYNSSRDKSPEATNGKVTAIRQSLAVVLAIGEAVWAVLDALISLTKPRSSNGGGGGQPLRPPSAFGSRIAANAEAS